MPEDQVKHEQELTELREEVRRLREEQDRQNRTRSDAQHQPGHEHDRQELEKSTHDRERKPHPHRKLLIIAGVILLLALAFIWWMYERRFEETDDATVDAHISGIAARVSGTVTAVYVDQNQFVKAGQALVDLDPRDYQIALEQARSQLLQAQGQSHAEQPNVPLTALTNQSEIAIANSAVIAAEAGIAAAERNHDAALQKVLESEANNAKAQADIARYQPLAEKDEVPREQFDQIVANAKALAATVAANQQAAQAALKQVEQAREQFAQAQQRARQTSKNAPRQLAIRRANVAARVAAIEAARAQLDQAALNLSYCKIVAPVNGIVAKRIAQVGQHVGPTQQVFLISETDDVWVTANFKETQLRNMRAGQSARIHVDALSTDFDGYVESMPAATGSITSLLPPENATGNFVKVVQRLPVRIRFKKDQDGLGRLRPGMSVEPKVRVR